MLQVKYLDSVKILSVDHDALIESLNIIASTIKKTCNFVKRIFLFGSFSKGNYMPESDVDIFVIVDSIDIPFIERRDIFLDFFKDIPFDVNILVYMEEEIIKMQERRDSFIRQIIGEALEL